MLEVRSDYDDDDSEQPKSDSEQSSDSENQVSLWKVNEQNGNKHKNTIQRNGRSGFFMEKDYNNGPKRAMNFDKSRAQDLFQNSDEFANLVE